MALPTLRTIAFILGIFLITLSMAMLVPMATLLLLGGRKDKLRPGDILGALTGDAGIPGDKVGKIAIFDYQAYVAVERSVAREALQRLQSGKIKGRAVKVRML